MKIIQYVLQSWAKEQGCRGITDAAVKAGFNRSTFGDWCRGVTVPRNLKQRAKLFQLTGHQIFNGPLTKETKILSLSEYDPQSGRAQCGERLSLLIRAIVSDLRCVVANGSVVDRERVRASLSTAQLVEFSTLARALSSEDAFNLLQKELRAMEGGNRDTSH